MKKLLFSAVSLDIGGIETALVTLLNHLAKQKENEKYKSLEKTLNDTLLLAQETSANAQKAAYAQSKLIVEDARNNASKIVNNSLIKAQNIEREAEELQRKVISYKKRFIALVESQVDEMDKFDERL